MRCIGGKTETLKFNLLNPLVVKYWYFSSGFRNKGTVARAKRFPRRWEITQPCPHFCEDEELESAAKSWNTGGGATILWPLIVTLSPQPSFQRRNPIPCAQWMDTEWFGSLAVCPVPVPCWLLLAWTYLDCSPPSLSCFYGTQDRWNGQNFGFLLLFLLLFRQFFFFFFKESIF